MKTKTIRKEAKKTSAACEFAIMWLLENKKCGDKTITKKVLKNVISSYKKAYKEI